MLAANTSGPQLMAAARREIVAGPPPTIPVASIPVPPPQQAAANGGTIVLNVNGSIVPVFVGKSLRAAVEAAQRAGVELDVHGSGIAREQVPAPGTRVPAGSRVSVRFAR